MHSIRLAFALAFAFALQTHAQKPIYPDAKPVCPCEDLAKAEIANTTVVSVAIDKSDGSCRVTATVTHAPANDKVTVWVALPVANWNGRFRGTGGGGFAGGTTNSLRGPVAQGYVAAATDTGHEGGSGSFALDASGRFDWQAIIDNSYLGIHDMTVVAKALTQKFYGKPPRFSYFVGQSSGGRQGITEAQRYPNDYDGILSACPAINWQRFLPADLWPQVVMNDANNFIPKAKLDAATAAAIAACDEADGAKDGVIGDPNACKFDPRELIGKEFAGSAFTESDANVIRRMWEGPRAVDGTFLWYGLSRGTDLFALAGTSGSPLRGNPFRITFDWFRFFLKQDPNWSASTLTAAGFEALWRQSVEQWGDVFGSDDPDLSHFRDRGGKLLIYHGLADQLIPAEGSVDYYKRIQEQMGGPEKTAQFARLFLFPGVDHGFRGPGPAPAGQFEALVRWVEEGIAPDQLNGERRDATGNVIGRRPIPAYGKK